MKLIQNYGYEWTYPHFQNFSSVLPEQLLISRGPFTFQVPELSHSEALQADFNIYPGGK